MPRPATQPARISAGISRLRGRRDVISDGSNGGVADGGATESASARRRLTVDLQPFDISWLELFLRLLQGYLTHLPQLPAHHRRSASNRGCSLASGATPIVSVSVATFCQRRRWYIVRISASPGWSISRRSGATHHHGSDASRAGNVPADTSADLRHRTPGEAL